MATSLAHRLVAGESGVLLTLVRLVLLPLTALYGLAILTKNALYDAGLLSPKRVDAAVVSVGNVTVGGTGKTPLTILMAQEAARQGRRVAVVSTGYGARTSGGDSDEVALMRSRCPDVDVVVAPDKGLGARRAAERGADLIFVDDGLQARHLHRDMDVVCIDARAPFSNGWVLPGGGLREAPSGIARADLLVMTHHESLSDERLEEVSSRVRAYNRTANMILGHHQPIGVRSVTDAVDSLGDPSTLAGRDVFLFCGIASPEGFRDTVEELGANVTGLMAFGDHHDFGPDDLARVRGKARTATLVCTEKDAMKVAEIPGSDDVLCVAIDLVLTEPLPAFPAKPEPESDDDHGHH